MIFEFGESFGGSAGAIANSTRQLGHRPRLPGSAESSLPQAEQSTLTRDSAIDWLLTQPPETDLPAEVTSFAVYVRSTDNR